tara:strand:+ start:45 stop:311 length:267 start_codon:yes stop_codon:yes gene_type:complete
MVLHIVQDGGRSTWAFAGREVQDGVAGEEKVEAVQWAFVWIAAGLQDCDQGAMSVFSWCVFSLGVCFLLDDGDCVKCRRKGCEGFAIT